VKVAIVHERFTEIGGSEHVVEALHEIWPAAPIHAAIIDPAAVPPSLRNADLRPSRLQGLYRGGRGYAHLLPLLPQAFARMPLEDVDLVVTSHHAFANRVRPTGAPVISYTHTPARWIWDRNTRRDEPGGIVGRALLGAFAATQRRPDRAAAARLQGIVANSHEVATRIRTHWGRDALVVAPPVDVEKYHPEPSDGRDDFFLLAGRLVPYKAPLVAVAAARRAGVRLVVAGGGRMRRAVDQASGPNIEVMGEVDDATLRRCYQRCRALVFPGREDFGIVPVEAQACGAPVVAPAVGGVLDSVIDGVTGILYPPGDDPVAALAEQLRTFDDRRFSASVIREHAESFGIPRFRAEMAAAVEHLLASS